MDLESAINVYTIMKSCQNTYLALTTPITHINYETIKERFKGYDKIV